MYADTQNVSVSYPFPLSHTNQIPFFFCAIPYHLIDSEVFPQLKGNHVKLLLVIDRYRNLKLKQKKFDQQLLSGWTIPVSQKTLADRCGVKRPTISLLVEELVGFGLLEKQLDEKSGMLQVECLQSHFRTNQANEIPARNGH